MTKTEARKIIISLLFEMTFKTESPEEIIEARDIYVNSFITKTIDGVILHMPEIDSVIEECCVGWKISRIPRVSLCILRLAVYEIMFADGIPIGASINEAVELAKEFASDDDPAYVNGVLGTVAKKYGK